MGVLNTNSIPVTVLEQNPIRQFASNPHSRTAAIKAKCAECFGCTSTHLERGFRASISECSSYSCPLHSFRPFQVKTTSK